MTTRRYELGQSLASEPDRADLRAWSDEHGVPDLPVPGWIEIDESARIIRYLGGHGGSPNPHDWHLRSECANPPLEGEAIDWCTEEFTLVLGKTIAAPPAAVTDGGSRDPRD